MKSRADAIDGEELMKTGFRLPITAASIAFASYLATTALAEGFVMKFGTATVNDPQHEYIKIYKEEMKQPSGGAGQGGEIHPPPTRPRTHRSRWPSSRA